MKLSWYSSLCLFGALIISIPSTLNAASSGDYAATPLQLTRETTPLVMLAMSVDHQLFYKAYADYTDLDKDGVIDTTYNDNFDYLGYFDPSLCYKYDNGDDYFYVSSVAANNVDVLTGNTVQHSCEGNDWSGNFLNWATMSRIDMLRYVLYGGKRYVDNGISGLADGEVVGQTILERTELPTDVHSFAKVFREYDATENPSGISWSHVLPDGYTEESITMCNTSSGGIPEMRIVEGSFESWASREETNGGQCQYDAGESAASTSDRKEDLVVRVEVCANGVEQLDTARCHPYSNGSTTVYKPIGLLQKYGESGRIEFGLISGSYHRNLDGGVIRKQISRIAGNEDASEDEVNLTDGTFNDEGDSAVSGIIDTLNKIRIEQYNGSGYTDCSSPGITLEEIKGDNHKRHCSNWGNPISEIYFEALRYFSGQSSPLDEFAGDISKWSFTEESDFIDGLPSLTESNSWTDPLNSENYCAECAIIVLSSGTPSFDSDGWNSRITNGEIVDITSATDLNKLTDQVGNLEYGDKISSSSTYEFIAESDGTCQPTVVDALSKISGLCPEGPQVEGGYQIAGLSYHSRITDLRTDFESKQTINTYAIELGESVPAIEFKLNDQTVRIVPNCQSSGGGEYLGCSLYNLIVRSPSYTDNGDLIEGSYIVFWEDSLWGNDYDLDGAQRIYICTSHLDGCGVDEGEVKIKQQWVYWKAGFALRASYSISGTASSGLNTSWVEKSGFDGGSPSFEFHDDTSSAPQEISTYTVDSAGSAAPLLYPPLYMAAKYGGFDDANENGVPESTEWDEIDNETGKSIPDGIPDQYYKVRNPSNLLRQLNQAFASIIERVASGSNAAVVANRSSGNGAIYQALYYPSLTKNSNTVQWVGQLHSLFVDDAGLIREDSNGNGILDKYPTTETVGETDPGDFIVDVYFDEEARKTYFQRYVLFDATGVDQSDGSTQGLTDIAVPYGERQDVTELDTVWNAAESLADMTDSEVVTQRDYDNSAKNGRHILTAVYDECVDDPSEECEFEIDFDTNNVGALAGYLGLDPDTESSEASSIIEFVRGKDQPEYRSRAFDILEGNGSLETWRLGDIVHSTPVVVEKPNSGYDLLHSDETYESFRNKYADRRRVVYVGGNDGMIHAFNGGYWNAYCNGFFTQDIVADSDGNTTCPSDSLVDASEDHPLGAELFSFIPTAMLPHLRWLTEPDYPHVYYVDGEPQAFDARIFEADDEHPYGWGTLLVVGFRQGGGTIAVDHDGDSGTADRQFRSGYVLLDITNPETAPELVAQISVPGMGHSFGKPTLVKRYIPSAASTDSTTGEVTGGDFQTPSESNWYLVFGNGPSDFDTGVSTSTANVYVYDLKEKILNTRPIDDSSGLTGMALSFTSIDWNLDAIDDAVYFGTVEGTVASQSGDLYRLRTNGALNTNPLDDLSNASLVEMVSTNKPIVVPPSATRSDDGHRWVHFGTGRFYVEDDRQTEGQQYSFGVREPFDNDNKEFTWQSVDTSALVESSNINIYNDGSVKQSDGTSDVQIDGETVSSYDHLVSAISSQGGWYRELYTDTDTPSGRILREASVYLDQLIMTEYLPSNDQCLVDGRSNLHVVSWRTGTALPYNPLGTIEDDDDSTADLVEPYIDVGVGEFSGGTVFETTNGITIFGDSDDEYDELEDLLNGTLSVSEVEDDSADDGNCVFIQSSTGEMTCVKVAPPEIEGVGRQSWKELEILF